MNKLKYVLLIIAILPNIWSCTEPNKNEAFDNLLKKKEYSVLMFFAPDCPLCHTFSKQFNELTSSYSDFQFIAVQSGLNYEAMEIKMFKDETSLKAPIFIDKDYSVAHRFKASVTPEFIVVNANGEVFYQGLLDDRMEALGVYKQQWSKHYLANALAAISEGKAIEQAKTDPIGCVLEY